MTCGIRDEVDMDEGLPVSNAQRSTGGQSVPTVCALFLFRLWSDAASGTSHPHNSIHVTLIPGSPSV